MLTSELQPYHGVGATATQPRVMLPPHALNGGRLIPSPITTTPKTPMGLCTPMDVATTSWRTQVCPFAPVRPGVNSYGAATPSSVSSMSSGIHAPTNLWPSPMPSPVGTMPPLWVGEAPCSTFSAPGTPASSARPMNLDVVGCDSRVSVSTPTDAGTTSWRRRVCPGAPLRPPPQRNVLWRSNSMSSTPRSPTDANTPVRPLRLLSRRPSSISGSSSGAHTPTSSTRSIPMNTAGSVTPRRVGALSPIAANPWSPDGMDVTRIPADEMIISFGDGGDEGKQLVQLQTGLPEWAGHLGA